MKNKYILYVILLILSVLLWYIPLMDNSINNKFNTVIPKTIILLRPIIFLMLYFFLIKDYLKRYKVIKILILDMMLLLIFSISALFAPNMYNPLNFKHLLGIYFGLISYGFIYFYILYNTLLCSFSIIYIVENNDDVVQGIYIVLTILFVIFLNIFLNYIF